MCALARRGIMSQATALGARMCQGTFFVLWQEGRRMFFIGGISSGVKPLEYLKTVICGRCGAYGRYQVYMTYMYFSFFFIPIFKWNRRFFVEMSCCGAVYELDPEVGKRLLRARRSRSRKAIWHFGRMEMEIRGREVMHHTVIRSVRPVDLRRMRIFRTVQSAANRCKVGK